MNAPGKTCARTICTYIELRIDDYCSIYCRDMDEIENKKDAEIAALKKKHDELHDARFAEARTVDALNAEIAGLRNVIDQLDAQVKVEGGGYKALADEIAGLRVNLHAFAAERYEARANLADADEALAACQDELGGQIQEHASLSESHAELSDRVVTLTDRLAFTADRWKIESDSWQERAEMAEAKIERLVAAGNKLEACAGCHNHLIPRNVACPGIEAWTAAKGSAS